MRTARIRPPISKRFESRVIDGACPTNSIEKHINASAGARGRVYSGAESGIGERTETGAGAHEKKRYVEGKIIKPLNIIRKLHPSENFRENDRARSVSRIFIQNHP